MKNITTLFLLCICASLHAQDAVDAISAKYQNQEREGLIQLHQRHVKDLIKVREVAMTAKDLPLANKADENIKNLESSIAKLGGQVTPPTTKNPGPLASSFFPSNNDYRMTWANGERSSEKGREIVCKFQRVSRLDQAKGTLVLTVITDSSAYSNTPNDVIILSGSKGKEIGRIKGIGTGRTQKIPLTLSAADSLEIVLVNHGSEAVRLKLFKEGIPELYLELVN